MDDWWALWITCFICTPSLLGHTALSLSFLYISIILDLKEQCHEIFCFRFFFHESSSPKPPKITLGSFRILPPVSLIPEVHLNLQIYLREFAKKFETALMVHSGAWGKLIHEKT
jgi:hypothetical protein